MSSRREIRICKHLSPDALDLAGFALAVLLFGALALRQLHLPGLYQDEAYDAAAAVRLLQGRSWDYTLLPGRLNLPLMVMDHVGPTSTYLLLPFLEAFGIGAMAVRVYELAVGLAALALAFCWMRRVLPAGTAWAAALLLAASPSFWLACRNGIHVSFVMVPIALGALICCDRWWRNQARVAWLYAGAFLLGLGLASKILFLWFIIALAVGVALARRQAFSRLRRRQVAVGAFWFAIGAAPLLIFNLLSRGLTLRTMLEGLRTTPYGVHNAAFLANLHTQLHSFASLLGGSWLTWTGAAPYDPAAVWLFTASAILLLLCWRSTSRRLLFCLLAVLVILVESCFTISTLGPKHLVIMLPLPQVITVGAIAAAWRRRAHRLFRAAFMALIALAALGFGWDLHSDCRYHRALAATGGVGQFSYAHNQLADFLVAHRVWRPLAGDWGFASNLEVLSAGRVRVRQIFELTEPPPYAFTRMEARRTLGQAGSVYLFHAEGIAAAPGRRQAVDQVAAQMRLRLVALATFADGLGRPVILVERPEPAREKR